MSIPIEWAIEMASFMGMGQTCATEVAPEVYEKAASYVAGKTRAPGFSNTEMQKISRKIGCDDVALQFLSRVNGTTCEKLASLELVGDATKIAAASPYRAKKRALEKIASGIETNPREFKLLCAENGLSPFVISKVASLFDCSRDELLLTHINGGPIDGMDKAAEVCDMLETFGRPLAQHIHDMEKVARSIHGVPGSDGITKIASRMGYFSESLGGLYEEMDKLAQGASKLFSKILGGFKGVGSKLTGAGEKALQNVEGMRWFSPGVGPKRLVSEATSKAEAKLSPKMPLLQRNKLSPKMPLLQRSKLTPDGAVLPGKESAPLSRGASGMSWAKVDKGPKKPAPLMTPQYLSAPTSSQAAAAAPRRVAPPTAEMEQQQRAALERLNQQRAARAEARAQRQTERLTGTPPGQAAQTATAAPALTDQQQRAALDRLNRRRTARAEARVQRQTERLATPAPAPAAAGTPPPATAAAGTPAATAQPMAETAQQAGGAGNRLKLKEMWDQMSPLERAALIGGGAYVGGEALG